MRSLVRAASPSITSRLRTVAFVLLLLLAGSGCEVASRWLLRPCIEHRHVSGIAVVCAVDIAPWAAAPEELKTAFGFALELAEANPEVFGYPTADFANNELVLRIFRPEGETMARAWIASGAELPTPKGPRTLRRPTVSVRLEPATRS